MSFIKVCPLAEIPVDGAISVQINGTQMTLVRTSENVYAVSDLCSHAQISLAQGEVYGTTIECWMHGSCFDLLTGKPTNPPATDPIATYPVKVEGGDVHVSPPSED
ncbi:MAG TPA: non-heme iron oxygenase ferredoxin subunit [Trebonia sp.]|jgi:3-phenylpropionate/trans-cinnamate dioxygenase ferredoxin subunit|nr:non-heme iron oxygenase ferredoxin subunit [Trebonia sp.]